MWAVVIAALSWLVWQKPGLPLLVGIGTYVLLTAAVASKRG